MIARLRHGVTRARDYDATLTLSYWPSLDAIRAFAGADIAVAKYYPDDRQYLLEFEPAVQHYEVTDSDATHTSRME